MDLEKNKEIFLDNLKDLQRDGVEKVVDWIEKTDFFSAPASTRYHNSCEGGLCDHSLNVYRRMMHNVANDLGVENVDDELMVSIATVSLLHDVCKIGVYHPAIQNEKVYSENGTKVDDLGRFDWKQKKIWRFEDDMPYGHGEKSVYILQAFAKYGFCLTRDEAFAIRFHMGDFHDGNTSKVFSSCSLAIQLHVADLQATYLDEK